MLGNSLSATWRGRGGGGGGGGRAVAVGTEHAAVCHVPGAHAAPAAPDPTRQHPPAPTTPAHRQQQLHERDDHKHEHGHQAEQVRAGPRHLRALAPARRSGAGRGMVCGACEAGGPPAGRQGSPSRATLLAPHAVHRHVCAVLCTHRVSVRPLRILPSSRLAILTSAASSLVPTCLTVGGQGRQHCELPEAPTPAVCSPSCRECPPTDQLPINPFNPLSTHPVVLGLLLHHLPPPPVRGPPLRARLHVEASNPGRAGGWVGQGWCVGGAGKGRDGCRGGGAESSGRAKNLRQQPGIRSCLQAAAAGVHSCTHLPGVVTMKVRVSLTPCATASPARCSRTWTGTCPGGSWLSLLQAQGGVGLVGSRPRITETAGAATAANGGSSPARWRGSCLCS